MCEDAYTHIYKERESEITHKSITVAYVIKVRKAFSIYVGMTHWVETNYTATFINRSAPHAELQE